MIPRTWWYEKLYVAWYVSLRLIPWAIVMAVIIYRDHLITQACHDRGGAYVGGECVKLTRLP